MDIEKLYPETKDYIWGGNKLREYGKTSDKDRIAGKLGAFLSSRRSEQACGRQAAQRRRDKAGLGRKRRALSVFSHSD